MGHEQQSVSFSDCFEKRSAVISILLRSDALLPAAG